MKIVQVCPRYYTYAGGAEKFVKVLSEELVKRGLEIEVRKKLKTVIRNIIRS